jgi:hypothetical protein
MHKNDLKLVWEWLRVYGTKADKERFRPVYKYIESLEKRIKELELIHDRHMVPQMFDKPPSDRELQIQMQVEKTRLQIKQEKEFYPLKQRLKDMIKDNQIGSKIWTQTLKWNHLSEEDALKIANDT